MFKGVNIVMALGCVTLMAIGLEDWAQLTATLLVAVNAYYLADVIY